MSVSDILKTSYQLSENIALGGAALPGRSRLAVISRTEFADKLFLDVADADGTPEAFGFELCWAFKVDGMRYCILKPTAEDLIEDALICYVVLRITREDLLTTINQDEFHRIESKCLSLMDTMPSNDAPSLTDLLGKFTEYEIE